MSEQVNWSLRVHVPVCSFRPFESREYQDTYAVPPLSTIYGMLLSYCGIPREERTVHKGAALALGLEGITDQASVFRKLRRGKELETVRPDYQDLLLGLTCRIWVSQGNEKGTPPLVERLDRAMRNPGSIRRAGGLSLGESSFLVDTFTRAPGLPDEEFQFLCRDDAGFVQLPLWVDHDQNHRTTGRFSLVSGKANVLLDRSWIRVE